MKWDEAYIRYLDITNFGVREAVGVALGIVAN